MNNILTIYTNIYKKIRGDIKYFVIIIISNGARVGHRKAAKVPTAVPFESVSRANSVPVRTRGDTGGDTRRVPLSGGDLTGLYYQRQGTSVDGQGILLRLSTFIHLSAHPSSNFFLLIHFYSQVDEKKKAESPLFESSYDRVDRDVRSRSCFVDIAFEALEQRHSIIIALQS